MAGESLFQNQRAPWLTVDETAAASVTTPPDTGDSRIFIDSADGLLKQKDDAGTVTVVGAAGITTHEADTTSAHTAEGIDIVDAGGIITATNVEAALQEIQTALDVEEAATAAHAADVDAHLHAAAHADGGTDELTVETLATAATDTSYALKPDGVGGVAFGTVSTVGALSDLSDVDTDKSKTPADGDVLTFDGTDWNAEAATGGSEAGTIASAFSWVLDAPSANDNWEFRVPFDCTIVGNEVYADASGSIVIDIWKDSYANYPPTDADSITASAPPTLSTADKSTDTTLTGWTTSLSRGDILKFNVDSVSTVTRVTLVLLIEASGTGGDEFELAYVEDTDGASITATSDATADTIMTLPAFTVDGNTEVVIDVQLRAIGNASGGDRLWVSLWEGSSDLGRMFTVEFVAGDWVTANGSVRITPSAGSHTYIVKAFMLGTGPITLTSGAGGTATYFPMTARATRANPTVNAANSGPSTGTAFPANPATGDRYRRSDLDYEVYFYDGTRWLSEQKYRVDLHNFSVMSAAVNGYAAFDRGGQDVYLTEMLAEVFPGSVDGSNYFAFVLQKLSTANSPTALASFDTSADTQNVWNDHSAALGAVVDVSATPVLSISVSATGSPPNHYGGASVEYRKVAT